MEKKKRIISFNEELHSYSIDGVSIPSVSTILAKTIFKDKYSGVDSSILSAKAKWGSEIHKAIETDMTFMLDDLQYQKYLEYQHIKEKYDLEPVLQEEIVYYELDSKVLYIGTLDMVARQLGCLLLVDIKTTYALDYEYLCWQLSMYKLAYEQRSGQTIDGVYAIWLPKRQVGDFYSIEDKVPLKSEEQIIKLIEKYREIGNGNN